MIISILTLFPECFESPLKASIIKRAQEKELVKFNVLNIRDFAQDKHKTTDDRPFGGGAGMVMKVEPIELALESLGVKKGQPDSKIVLTSAKGEKFVQEKAREFSGIKHLVIICGHYQDVDQRVVDHLVDEEVSIGDYILTGGEPAALVITDAVTRLLPGVLGNAGSLQNESHDQPGEISPPSYTRPADYKGQQVPEVLLSGDPKKIESWKENLGSNSCS